MKISIAQTKPIKGDIEQNTQTHLRFLELAVKLGSDAIFFPELSLTGYEPDLARDLAMTQDDLRLDVFQEFSDKHNLVIGIGLPTKTDDDIFISMVIFQSQKPRLTYSKQFLYPTEVPIYTAGNQQFFIQMGENDTIAPAICYELSNPQHAAKAHKNNSTVYVASVLNSVNGVDSDLEKLSTIAKQYKMTTLMANFVGTSGGYICAGKSSVWNTEGVLIGQLDAQNEGLLVVDTETQAVFAYKY
jgi:predicted amidohydrolase